MIVVVRDEVCAKASMAKGYGGGRVVAGRGEPSSYDPQ